MIITANPSLIVNPGVEKVKEAHEKNKKIASSGDELDKDSDIK